MSLCLHWLLDRRLSYIWMACSLAAASTSCFPPGNSQVRFSALPSSYSLFSGCYRLHTLLLHRRALWMFLYNVCIRYHTSGRTRQMDPNRSKHSQWLQNTVQRYGVTRMLELNSQVLSHKITSVQLSVAVVDNYPNTFNDYQNKFK